MKENLPLGVCSFVIGLGLGMLLQQVLLVVLYSVIQVELRPHLEFNGYCFLMTVSPLCRMLSAGTVPVQPEIPQDEHS